MWLEVSEQVEQGLEIRLKSDGVGMATWKVSSKALDIHEGYWIFFWIWKEATGGFWAEKH